MNTYIFYVRGIDIHNPSKQCMRTRSSKNLVQNPGGIKDELSVYIDIGLPIWFIMFWCVHMYIHMHRLSDMHSYLPNYLHTWSMMSNGIQSSKSPTRNPQHPPSPQLSISHPNKVRSWSNFQDRPLSNQKHNLDVQLDTILKVSSQEPSTSSKYDFEGGGFLKHFYSC